MKRKILQVVGATIIPKIIRLYVRADEIEADFF